MADFQQPQQPGMPPQQPQQPQPQPGMPPQPQPAVPQPPQPQPQVPQNWQQSQTQPYYAQPGVPAPEPQQPVRHHVHHSYIWLGSLSTALMLLVIAFISGFSGIVGSLAEGDTISPSDIPVLITIFGVTLGVFVVVTGLVALYQWVSYKHLYYELTAEEFNLYLGIFNKKRVHVPYQRIQSVDQRATLLQRIFGVCTVSVDTAGGAANKAVKVPYVQKMQAEELRRELFARKQYLIAQENGATPAAAAAAAAAIAMPSSGVATPAASMPGAPAASNVPGTFGEPSAPHNVLDAPAEIWQDVHGVFGGGFVDTGRVTYEYGMSNKELIFTGLSNNTAFVVVILVVFGTVVELFGQAAPILFKPVIESVASAGLQAFGGNLIVAGITAFVLGAIALWVISAIGACIAYGGFRACRRDNRVEVERGLLQHQFQSVSIDRVQSVVVKQSFIRRMLGYCELSLGKIDAAAEGSDQEQQSALNRQGLVIHPFVKLTRVPEILAGIIPEFADVPAESTPVAPVALRRALIRRGIIQGDGFWLAVIIAIAQVCCNVFIPANGPDAELLGMLNTWAFVGYALCVVLLILNLISAVLWYRGSGFAYNRRFMQISNGGLSRETISFPRKKIQFGFTKTNPFQRRARTATIHARTAAGVGGTTIKLIDAREEDAAAWLEWLRPGGSATEE